MSDFVITTSPALLKALINDLKSIDSSCALKGNFGDGRYLVSFSKDKDTVTNAIVGEHHSFIKHIHPVRIKGDLQKELENDIQTLHWCVERIGLSTDKPFSIQVRSVENEAYTAKDVEVKLGQYVEQNYPIEAYFNDYDIPDDIGQQIISILICGTTFFMGFSSARDNLYPVSDPYRIFSRWEAHISRAEFKLREALKVIGYKPVKGNTALDLGAAPGGWSYVLAEAGMKVIAVDPAALDERVSGHNNVTHVKTRAEDHSISEEIALIVNDMNMDPAASARAVLAVSDTLKPGGMLVMTIKLTHGPYGERIDEAIETLSPQFKPVDVRCLFHNRREVTGFFEKTQT